MVTDWPSVYSGTVASGLLAQPPKVSSGGATKPRSVTVLSFTLEPCTTVWLPSLPVPVPALKVMVWQAEAGAQMA